MGHLSHCDVRCGRFGDFDCADYACRVDVVVRAFLNRLTPREENLSFPHIETKAAFVIIDEKRRQNLGDAWGLREDDGDAWADKQSKMLRTLLSHTQTAFVKNPETGWVKMMKLTPTDTIHAETSSKVEYTYSYSQDIQKAIRVPIQVGKAKPKSEISTKVGDGLIFMVARTIQKQIRK